MKSERKTPRFNTKKILLVVLAYILFVMCSGFAFKLYTEARQVEAVLNSDRAFYVESAIVSARGDSYGFILAPGPDSFRYEDGVKYLEHSGTMSAPLDVKVINERGERIEVDLSTIEGRYIKFICKSVALSSPPRYSEMVIIALLD